MYIYIFIYSYIYIYIAIYCHCTDYWLLLLLVLLFFIKKMLFLMKWWWQRCHESMYLRYSILDVHPEHIGLDGLTIQNYNKVSTWLKNHGFSQVFVAISRWCSHVFTYKWTHPPVVIGHWTSPIYRWISQLQTYIFLGNVQLTFHYQKLELLENRNNCLSYVGIYVYIYIVQISCTEILFLLSTERCPKFHKPTLQNAARIPSDWPSLVELKIQTMYNIKSS